MKLAFTSVLCLFALCSYSCDYLARLNLRISNDESFTIKLDDRSYLHASNIFNLNLLPGKHYLAVTSVSGRQYYSGLIDVPKNADLYAYVDYAGIHIEQMLTLNNNCNCTSFEVHEANDVFFTFKWNLRKIPSPVEKVKRIRRYVLGKTVTCFQLAELIDEVSAENYKIEIAKFSYPYVSDPLNYIIVIEAMRLPSSRKEVEDYISGLEVK